MSAWERMVEEELGRSPAIGKLANLPTGGFKYSPRGGGRDAFRGAEVYGLKELQEALDMVVPTLANKALRSGSRKAANLVKEDAKKRAPVGDPDDPHYQQVGEVKTPGELKRAIRVRAMPRSRTTMGSMVTVGESLFTGDQYYAGFQELGWIHTGRRRLRGAGRKIEGKSFLRGALYDNSNRVHAVYVHETKNKFNEITRKVLADSGGSAVYYRSEKTR